MSVVSVVSKNVSAHHVNAEGVVAEAFRQGAARRALPGAIWGDHGVAKGEPLALPLACYWPLGLSYMYAAWAAKKARLVFMGLMKTLTCFFNHVISLIGAPWASII